MNKSAKYLIIAIITFIVGYLFLRFAYQQTTDIPFAQEIVLMVLGTIVTIVITASLLNKQSEIELEKEQRVKIFDIKSTLYFELIEFIEKIISKQEIKEKDLINLEFLTHKVSIIASSEVLKQYSAFLKTIKKTASDKKISALESDELSINLAKLCGKIRYDLLIKEEKQEVDIQKIIEANIDSIG